VLFAFILHFLIYFHCSTSIPYRGQKANWLYQERKFLGTFAPGNESSREHSFPAAKVPRNFRSWERRLLLGTFAPKSENTGERKVPIPLALLCAIPCDFDW